MIPCGSVAAEIFVRKPALRGTLLRQTYLAAVLLILLCLPLCAGEVAVLKNGFTMRVERHETVDGNVVLHTASGEIVMQAAQFSSFEAEDSIKPAPAALPAPPASPAAKPAAATPQELVQRAAEKYGLPPALLHSVAKAESGYQVAALSPKGAIGLMQLMPATAAELNADPNDPEQNADAGARYLRELLIRYDGSAHRALAAYNAGPGAVERYNGVPPYRETREYIDRILRDYAKRALR
jgi:soluble lytic murein transglycosylase-like protein